MTRGRRLRWNEASFPPGCLIRVSFVRSWGRVTIQDNLLQQSPLRKTTDVHWDLNWRGWDQAQKLNHAEKSKLVWHRVFRICSTAMAALDNLYERLHTTIICNSVESRARAGKSIGFTVSFFFKSINCFYSR